MSQKIEFELAANDTSAKAAWERQQKAINGVIEKLGKLEDASAKAGRTQEGWLTGGVQKIGGLLTGLASVTTALNLMGREYDNMVQRQNKAFDIQKTLAASQRQAVLNLGVDPNWNAEKLTNELRAMSGRAGIDEALLTATASDALSARGDMSVENTLKAVEAAAKLMPDAPASLPMLAASAMDLSKGSGATAEQSIGFLQSVGAASRVTSLKNLAENIAPAITGMTKFGDSEQEAGAILASLSGGMVDTTGAQTKTTGIALAQQLEKMLPKEEDTLARIRKLQSDPKLAAKFMKESSFERQAFPVIRALLSADAGTAERRGLEAALNQVVDIKAGDSLYGSSVAAIDELPAVKAARVKQTMDAVAATTSASDESGARAAVFRDALGENLKASKVSDTAQRVTMSQYEARVLAGESPANVAASLLRDQSRAFANPMVAPSGPGGMPTARPATETERFSAEKLAEAAKTMERAAMALEKAAAKPMVLKKPDVPIAPVGVRAGVRR